MKWVNRYYVGYTTDLATRLAEHNVGISAYTSKARDWILKHKEKFDTREQAMSWERTIKAKKSRKYLEYLIKLS
ncbi:MAG: GIY-YIG nuclease family protein [Bacteroidota bacterium]